MNIHKRGVAKWAQVGFKTHKISLKILINNYLYSIFKLELFRVFLKIPEC